MMLPNDSSSESSQQSIYAIGGIGSFAFFSCLYGVILLLGLMGWLNLAGYRTLIVCLCAIAFIDFSYIQIKASVANFDESSKKSSLFLTVIHFMFDVQDKNKARQLGQGVAWTFVFGSLCVGYASQLFAGKLALTKSALVILSAIPIYLVIRYVVVVIWKKSNKKQNEIDGNPD